MPRCRLHLAVAALLLALLVCAAPASAAQESHSGELTAGCNYNASVDTDASTFQLTIDCPPKSVSVTANGSYDAGGVTVATLDFTVLGQTGSIDVDYRLDFPAGVTDAEAMWRDAAQGIAQISVSTAAQRAVPHDGDSATASTGGVDALLGQFNTYCKGLDFGAENGFCSKAKDTSPSDGPVNPLFSGAEKTDSSGQSSDADKQQQEACPQIQTALPNLFVVCVPMYVGGDAQVPGDKDLLVMPGGALIAVPIGDSLDNPTTPHLHTKGAIVITGAPVGGSGLHMEAGKDIAMAGAVVSTIGPLQLDAAALDVGQVETSRVLAGLPPDVQSWLPTSLISQLAAGDKITQPALIYAPNAKLNVTGATRVFAGGTISASGLGIGGGVANFLDGQVPPRGSIVGASNDYGGTYGGSGGYDDSLDPVGPGTSYGNPFDPDQAGSGGAGSNIAGANGSAGGGVLRIDSKTLALDGTVRVDGDDVSPSTYTYASGGGGAGGSISIRLGALSGHGNISADGGSFTSSGLNEGAGAGGGGRVAVRYARRNNWHGKVHAYGGRDTVSRSPATSATHVGAGGAGTLYWLRTGGGKRKPADDQLVVDAGGSTAFPPPQGTPVAPSWSRKKRELLVKGGARVWTTTINFGTIVLQGASVITTRPGDERDDGLRATALDRRKLTVKAETLTIDRSSRIDMTSRGYAGGGQKDTDDPSDDPGRGPPGHIATSGNGGSHGGKGGQPSNGATDPAASEYDSANAPSQPGAGGAKGDFGDGTAGGGVLFVTAKRLTLMGTIAADGKSGTGPTLTDSTPDLQDEGGMGAGGSIQVRAKTLSGRGSIHANGGSLCLKAPEVLPGVRVCNDEAGGGGGGGRVRVHIHSKPHWKGHVTARGGSNHARPSAQSNGHRGTVVGI